MDCESVKNVEYTFMPDMLASMYFKTEDPMTGRLFRFQPDVIYSWRHNSNIKYSYTSPCNILSTKQQQHA